MKAEFLKFLSEKLNIAEGSRIVVACSGGADSMCLLNLFLEIRDELKLWVEAAHVNHGIRGDEADRDEEFVRNFCNENNVHFYSLKVSVPEIAENTSESIELCARRIRYEFFESLDCDYVATAHTASDRIETMLMNLSRGTSLSGLCSIPASRGRIIRPLIDFTRGEIEEYCRLNSLKYVTDSTNLTDEYTRNKFRHNVIEQLKGINPSFEANAVRCIRSLNEENDFLDKVSQKAYSLCLDADGALLTDELKKHDTVIIKRVIKLFFEANNVRDYESRHIDYIVEKFDNEFALMLPYVRKLNSRNNRLFFEVTAASETVKEQILDVNGDSVIRCSDKLLILKRTDKLPVDSQSYCYADAGKISDGVCLRSRKSGDEFHLPKRRCTKTLKKLFNELKIPVCERDSLLVISDDKGLIFVEGIGVDALRQTGPDTKEYLLIKVEDIKNE